MNDLPKGTRPVSPEEELSDLERLYGADGEIDPQEMAHLLESRGAKVTRGPGGVMVVNFDQNAFRELAKLIAKGRGTGTR
jgi:hypothetical protein